MPEESVKTFTVGCKLPNGIHLDLKNNAQEATRFTLNGANSARIVGGHGITENIPADFMNAWLKKNAKHPAVINGSIFIHETTRGAESVARERAKVLTGIEPLDPVKAGVLKGTDAKPDPAALAAYEAQKAQNPDRNLQRQE